jgi:hypothetical protein
VHPEKLNAANRKLYEESVAYHETVIALTEPSWILNASASELMQVLMHLKHRSN